MKSIVKNYIQYNDTWDEMFTEKGKIRDIYSIDRKPYYSGSVTSSISNEYVSGSWDDYWESGSTDLTVFCDTLRTSGWSANFAFFFAANIAL